MFKIYFLYCTWFLNKYDFHVRWIFVPRWRHRNDKYSHQSYPTRGVWLLPTSFSRRFESELVFKNVSTRVSHLWEIWPRRWWYGDLLRSLFPDLCKRKRDRVHGEEGIWRERIPRGVLWRSLPRLAMVRKMRPNENRRSEAFTRKQSSRLLQHRLRTTSVNLLLFFFGFGIRGF